MRTRQAGLGMNWKDRDTSHRPILLRSVKGKELLYRHYPWFGSRVVRTNEVSDFLQRLALKNGQGKKKEACSPSHLNRRDVSAVKPVTFFCGGSLLSQ